MSLVLYQLVTCLWYCRPAAEVNDSAADDPVQFIYPGLDFVAPKPQPDDGDLGFNTFSEDGSRCGNFSGAHFQIYYDFFPNSHQTTSQGLFNHR
jgi:hypothetical protein